MDKKSDIIVFKSFNSIRRVIYGFCTHQVLHQVLKKGPANGAF